MVMRLFVGGVSADIDGERGPPKIECGRPWSRRVSIVSVPHFAGMFARGKCKVTSERENLL
jgi:hypothetical protein